MMDAVMPCVWLLKNKSGKIGGGVCCSQEGLVITSAIFLRNHSANEVIQGRTHDSSFRNLKILFVDNPCLLAIVEVRRKTTDEGFFHVELGNIPDLNRGDYLKAIVHQDLTPFAIKHGRICFALHPKAFEVKITGQETVYTRLKKCRRLKVRTDKEKAAKSPFYWRTSGHVLDIDEGDDVNKYASRIVDPNLPLLQTQSLGWGDGVIGSPVFLGDSPFTFVGVMAFSKCFEFIISSPFVSRLLTTWKDHKAKSGKPSTSRMTSSQKRKRS